MYAVIKLILVNEMKSSKFTFILKHKWGILSLELSSYVLEIPNDAFTSLIQSRVLQADRVRLENNGKANEL